MHWSTEQHIISTGIGYTFLRANFYTDFFVDMVGDDGALRCPAGNGRVALIMRTDVAQAAATVLQNLFYGNRGR